MKIWTKVQLQMPHCSCRSTASSGGNGQYERHQQAGPSRGNEPVKIGEKIVIVDNLGQNLHFQQNTIFVI